MDEPIVLSASDRAEIEKIYRRNTTPWRCRLGLHAWEPWTYMCSFAIGAQNMKSGKGSVGIQIDLHVHLCPRCMKAAARTEQHTVPGLMAKLEERGEA